MLMQLAGAARPKPFLGRDRKHGSPSMGRCWLSNPVTSRFTAAKATRFAYEEKRTSDYFVIECDESSS